MLPTRLGRLPSARVAGFDVRRADTPLARLRGLAGLRELPRGTGLLLPRTRSVHTFGMRVALDLVWIDGDERVVRVDRAVPPGRVRACRAASAVIELPAAPRAI
jgi:uncharacterized membrane protein (UPF0127 family)